MDNSKDYPVMLYLGGLDSHAIAHDEDEADALKAKGYVTHAEAVKIEPDNAPTDSGSKGDTEDQLAEAYEHIELLEGAIEVKDKEIADLKELNAKFEMDLSGLDMTLDGKNELITDLKAERDKANEWSDEVTGQNELHRATIRELREKLAIYEETKDKNGNGKVDYEEMTNAELQKLLDQRKVNYNKRDGKDALIQKLKDSEKNH